MEGTPQQGYQSRFTPQEVYRIAIREIDQHCRAEFDRPFAQLAGDRQLRLLEQLEKDEIALPSLSSKLFFDLLWRNTEEGYFADPLYGSNRDVVAGIRWVAGESLTGQAGLHNRKPSAVPFKHHAEHRHHIPRARYRVTNQPEYDAALRRRGGAAA
jgi:hypothetical protein